MYEVQPEGARACCSTRNSARKSRLPRAQPGEFIHRHCCKIVTASQNAEWTTSSAKLVSQRENSNIYKPLSECLKIRRRFEKWRKTGIRPRPRRLIDRVIHRIRGNRRSVRNNHA